MADSISTASLLLTVDSKPWDQGLKQSESNLGKWGTRARATADKAAKDMAAATPKLGSSATPAIPSSLSGVQAALLPPALSASLSLVKDMVSAFSMALDKLVQTVKVSKELGQSVEGFSSLEQAAKLSFVQTEDLQNAIVALESKLNSSEASAFFQKLGIDADALRTQDIVGKFAAVSDAYKGMKDSGQKNALFMELFLGSATKMVPLLKEGGNAIRQNAADALKAGAALDEAGARAAARAAKAKEYAAIRLGGAWNSVVVAGADLVNMRGVEDIVKELEEEFKHKLKDKRFTMPVTPLLTPWAEPGYTPSVLLKPSGNQMDKELSRLNQPTFLNFDQFKKDYKDAITTVGMTSPELKIFNLEKAGVKGALLDSLKEIRAEANVVAFGLVELTPLKLFNKQLDALKGARKALGDDRFNMGISKATQQLIAASGIGPQKTVGGLVKDSSAAVSAIITSELQDRFDNDPAAQLREAQAALLEQAKQQNVFGGRIADYLRIIAERGGKIEEEF